MPGLNPILVVEDNNQDLELTLSALLRCRLANEIVVARDGVEALDFLYGRGAYEGQPPRFPAVVLLDLKMPKIGGLEVLEQIKTDRLHQQTPIVMLTGSCEDRDLGRSYELGANGYVVKPVHFIAFFEAIQDLGIFWAVVNEPTPKRALN